MNKGSTTGLWAVQWFHKSGYQASIYQVVEAENREDAVGMAEEVNCRLRDFECWNWKLIRLPYQKNENGKWFPKMGNPSKSNENIRRKNSSYP